MICFVCTKNSDQTLSVFGDDEVHSKIAEVIEKHLCLTVSHIKYETFHTPYHLRNKIAAKI